MQTMRIVKPFQIDAAVSMYGRIRLPYAQTKKMPMVNA